ncbi:MAG TPA: citrate synthase [Spirochaetota bacterium]|nr:citrate synthase [Spirochaetota bacterium]
MIDRIVELVKKHDEISPDIIRERNVKLGLRNADGTGVVAGITGKGSVIGYNKVPVDREKGKFDIQPCDGRLYYCGYDVAKMVKEYELKNRFGYEEVAYLLLTGVLPTAGELDEFREELARRRGLTRAERNVIMESAENDNQMYALHTGISHLSRCDRDPDSIDISDVTGQCLNLIAKFPTIVASNYSVSRFMKGSDLKLVRPRADLGTAENFLYMFTGSEPDRYEARIFDMALVLHAEHGGGNNSTFAVRVVSSSGANTYMAIAAGIASLSGHLHGGANESVNLMMKDLKKRVKDWSSEKKVRNYLTTLLEKKAGNKSGKIYGFGHAVYTLSDPRAIILKKHAEDLAKMKGPYEEFLLYDKVEKIAVELLAERTGKTVSANVDFYSGFVYEMLGIPRALYTPIFAMARVAGWAAHRLEQLVQNRIMRPAYINPFLEEKPYPKLENR